MVSNARAANQPLLMGVLNLTPDSFFDGGQYVATTNAERQIDALVAAGADIVDIGAESSRPGAPRVTPAEQIRRFARHIEYCLARGVAVSVDTTAAEVAAVALDRGAEMVNDVSCLQDPGLAEVTAKAGAMLVITHSRAPMSDMAGFSQWPDDDYPDIVSDVTRDWERARGQAAGMGLSSTQIIFDPGLGFSKNARQSFELLRRLREFCALGVPLLVGPGRKSFIAAADPSAPSERLAGTVAASLLAAQQGANILRIHDVREVRQALRVWYATQDPDRVRAASGAEAQPTPVELPRVG